jgi:NADPH:quinone reductase-like Zn-dependent oxidoreductase
MKVTEINEYGTADELVQVERPEPAAVDGEVRVRITARPVNPADLATRAGAFAARTPHRVFPLVLGWEFAGTVVADAAPFTAGQRVFGMLPWFSDTRGRGSYAEIVSVEPGWITEIPDGVDDATAAVTALNGQTAIQALDLAGDLEGRTVVITGVSGGVGSVAAFVAVERGADVIAIAADDDREFVASLGVRSIVTRGTEQDEAEAIRRLASDGVDAVLDAASAAPWLIGVVRDGGRFVAVTDPAEPAPERGVATVTVHTEPRAEHLGYLAERLESGSLPARLGRSLPVAEAAAAHRLAESGAAGRGKIVLTA